MSPERPHRKSKSTKIHIRRMLASAKSNERKNVEFLMRQVAPSKEKTSPRDIFIKLVNAKREDALRMLETLPEVKRGPATDMEAEFRLKNLASDIRSKKISTLGQIERTLDRLGPLIGLFTAFGGPTTLDMRQLSNRVLVEIKNRLPDLTQGKR